MTLSQRLLPPLALGTGLYLALLVASAVLHGGAGVDGLWLTRRLPSSVMGLLATATAAALIAFAWGHLRGPAPRAGLGIVLALLSAWALRDVVAYVSEVRRGSIVPGDMLPASAFVALVFAVLSLHVLGVLGKGAPDGLALDQPKRWLALGLLVPVLAPLVQFATFGTTRYEREADVALVMGAGVGPHGTVSQAAATRVEESVRLYQRGSVKRIEILAGDDNEGAGMAKYALRFGVPAHDISYRADCVNTERAAALSAADLAASGERALIVSHYYHLPRIRLLYAREGARIHTVPAVMERRLRMEPYYLAREIASTYHELLFRSKVGPVVKGWLAAKLQGASRPGTSGPKGLG